MSPCRRWISAASFVVVSGAMAGDSLPLRVNRLPDASLVQDAPAAAPFVRPPTAVMADVLTKEVTREAPFLVRGASPSKAISQGRTATREGGPHRLGTGTPLQLRPDANAAPTMTAMDLAAADRDLSVAREFLRRNAAFLHLAEPEQELVL